jgi:hypothetical protein
VGRSEAGCGLEQRVLPCRPISFRSQAEQQLIRARQAPGRGGAGSSGRRTLKQVRPQAGEGLEAKQARPQARPQAWPQAREGLEAKQAWPPAR